MTYPKPVGLLVHTGLCGASPELRPNNIHLENAKERNIYARVFSFDFLSGNMQGV